MPFTMGPTELIVVLVIALALFGARKLPEVGGAVGRGIREFRSAQWGEPRSPAPRRAGRSHCEARYIVGVAVQLLRDERSPPLDTRPRLREGRLYAGMTELCDRELVTESGQLLVSPVACGAVDPNL